MSPIDARHAELLSLFTLAEAAYQAARGVVHESARVRDELAIKLLELEGRGSSPAAEWLRANVAGDHVKAEAIRKAHPETYWDDAPRVPAEEQAATPC